LNVRGICCLRPGIEGISENIRVVSIVGRLLEHSRVYAFERHGEHKVYIASADLMPRNLDHRVELSVPIEAEDLRVELLDVLERCFADNQNSWDLDGNGIWARRAPGAGDEPRSVQQELAELYTVRAATDRPSGERGVQAADARERAVAATAQPVAAAGSASRARLSSSTDW
jgi:polyphosphate kinase